MVQIKCQGKKLTNTLLGPVGSMEVARKEVQRLRRGALGENLIVSFFLSCLSLARLTAPFMLAYFEALIRDFGGLWTDFRLACCGPGFVLVIPKGKMMSRFSRDIV